ncbi:MAG TPA: YhbY family RNA-binding protein [Bacillota bacterium]|nr:YhbY family RNA-binding protein [Bacillota bacterium]
MLTSKERGYLRALGNKLEPILIIGKSGVTDQVEEQLDQALTARELVKGRVLPHTEFEVDEVAADLASRTQAEVVQVIGRNVLFYRASDQNILGEFRSR